VNEIQRSLDKNFHLRFHNPTSHNDFSKTAPRAGNDMHGSPYGDFQTLSPNPIPTNSFTGERRAPNRRSARTSSTQSSLSTNSHIASFSSKTGESSLTRKAPSVKGKDFATQAIEKGSRGKEVWILSCFRSTEFDTKAFHENVKEGKSDYQIFERFREIYFAERSWFRRFFELKEVKNIKFVMFDLLPLDIASIRQENTWPPAEEKARWLYVPCPAKVVPLVGPRLLLHLWRNPHHSDEMAYREWHSKANLWKRFRDRFRHFPKVSKSVPTNEPNEGDPIDHDQVGNPHSSTYVFVKIPKKIGDRLEPNYGNEAPEGWGIYFEEGFKVHRLLFVVLIFYFFASLSVIAWIIDRFGITTPTTYMGLFSVLAWLISFSSLFLTVWFKWAESG